MCFVVSYVTFRAAYSVAVTFTVLLLLIRHFNRFSQQQQQQQQHYLLSVTIASQAEMWFMLSDYSNSECGTKI